MEGSVEYHVLTRRGDALSDIEREVSRLGSREAAGLHRYFYVSRANQTVVMATHADAPIAKALRALPAWDEPSGR